MKKRVLSALLALMMVMSLLSVTVGADDVNVEDLPEFVSWADMGEETAFKISTEATLWALGTVINQDANGTYNMSGISFYLANDIELQSAWTSIKGVYAKDHFAGTFDGQGHTISGLSVSTTGTNQGFFGATSTGAAIKNLNVEGNVTSTGNYVGGIVGYAQATTLENCSFSGSVISTSGYAGGIVGGLNGGSTKIESCVNNATVNGVIAGGILGYTTGNNTIVNCYNTGAVSGSSHAGGIAGQLSTGTITNCYNVGTCTTSATNAGGVYGFSNATISNGYYLYPATQTLGGNGNGVSATKITAPSDLTADMLGDAFVADTDNINSGYPVLSWQGAPDFTPAISLSGGTSLVMGSVLTTTLTATPKNVEGAPTITWAIEKKGGGAADAIATMTTPEGESNTNRIITAVGGGVVTVTASVTIAGDTYTATRDVMVIPQFTTASIVNVNTPGTIAVGQTVEAKVFVLGAAEYDYANLPPLTYQWKYRPGGGSVGNITGATGDTYTIPATYNEWDYIHLEVKCGGEIVVDALDTYASIRSADYGTLYPVAYDEAFTLPTDIKADGNLTLLTSHTVGGTTTSITWSSNNAAINATTGAVTRPNIGTTSATLTARFEYGGAFANRTFSITVWSAEAVTEAENNQLAPLQAAAAELGSLLTPVFGTDSNVLTMARGKLTAGHSDVTVALKSATVRNGGDSCEIDTNGDITYFYADPNTTPVLHFGTYDLVLTLSKGGVDLDHPMAVTLYWDVDKVKAALTAEILRKLTAPTTATGDFSLPKVVDGKMWAQIAWSSSDPAIYISAENQTTADTLFNPFVAKIQPTAVDTPVTLTAAITFQFTSDIIGHEPPIVLYKTFNVTVKANAAGQNAIRDALMAKLDAGFAGAGLRDYVSGAALPLSGDIYTAAGDITLPTTRDFEVDGKYQPVTVTTSNNDIFVAPDVANAARVSVYRPPVGAPAATETLAVTITDKASGISATKVFTIRVEALTQSEIDAELALMAAVKTSYFEGIRNQNPTADNVTTNLRAFQEALMGSSNTLVWAYDIKDTTGSGIVPVAMDGWYDLEIWRLFRTSNAAVITHENLLVTRQANAKQVTIESALSSAVFGKYGERYKQNPTRYAGYAALAGLYYQPVSQPVIVRGTANPQSSTPVVESLTVSFSLKGRDGTWITPVTVSGLDEGTTAYEVFTRVLTQNRYTFDLQGSYVCGITTPQGLTLKELDGGRNSGWMYTVNGTLSGTYLAAHALRNGDSIVVFYTSDYTQESGSMGGTLAPTPTTPVEIPSQQEGVTVEPKEDGSYQVSVDRTEDAPEGPVRVILPDVPDGSLIVIVHPDGTETVVKKSLVADGRASLLLSEGATLKVVGNTTGFADAPKDSWFGEAVSFVAGRGLFVGTGANSFSPELPMTRGMLVTVLFRLEEAAGGIGAGFSDVDADAWYADAVGWAAACGIVLGNSDGSFGAEQSIIRQQLAAMLYRYGGMVGLDVSDRADLSCYGDHQGVSTYAEDAMAWAVENGLIQGYPDGTLQPGANATRAEVAVILERLVGLLVG